MGTTLTIYTQRTYKEHMLSAGKNQEERIFLDSNVFNLKNSYILKLENIDNEWYFIDENNEILAEGKKYCKEPLQDGQNFLITTQKNKEVIAVTVNIRDSFFGVYDKYVLTGNDLLRIGSKPDNDIQVTHLFNGRAIVSGYHAELIRQGTSWILKQKGPNGSFVNEIRVDNEKVLEFGDVIAVWGLKIVFLGNAIAINRYDNLSINNKYLIKLDKAELYSNDSQKGDESSKKDEVPEKQFFHRSPRSIEKLNTEPVEIEMPPQAKEENETPLFNLVGPSFTMMLPMLLGSGMAILSSRSSGAAGGSFMFTGIITAASSGILAAFWAINNMRFAKKRAKEEETKRFDAYSGYLMKCTDEIKDKYMSNTRILKDRYPDSDAIIRWNDVPETLWQRNPKHFDFLYHRLGVGNIPFQVEIGIPKERFTMSIDTLADKPKFIKDSYSTLIDVPVGADLLADNLIGIVGGDRKRGAFQVIQNLIAQLTMLNSYTEVKIALISAGENSDGRETWDYLSWFPHVWSPDKKFRYISLSREEASDVCYELTQILRQRSEGSSERENRTFLPHYVVIVEDSSLLEGELLAKYLYGERKLGFTTLVLAERAAGLPNQCEKIIQNDDKYSGIIDLQYGVNEGVAIKMDHTDNRALAQLSHKLANVELNESEIGGEIPVSITFFEMYGVNTLEELHVKERWRKNRIYESMRALIGVKSGGQMCYLDLHEKYHGPHGLVAGTTGSGKSETLQTYLLSLALNFSPDDVGFFIIDFKGGGMGNLFSDLPHVLGQISNLSGNQVRRAMVSIKSENTRRQMIFNQNGVNNINAYTRLYKNGEAKLPVPHLFIIIDEFAELKREEPEFMQELISVAQVGRSLGVHLILATQKPSGTVDDNIWSNTKFRLCLRVQDKQDSMDMLHKPDAAFLTQAGRGYLQVGNDELYEQFQSGWSGAVYDEEAGALKQDIAKIITNTGRTAIVGNHLKTLRKENITRKWLKHLIETVEKVTPDADNEDTIISRIFGVLAQEGYDLPVSDFNLGLMRNFYMLYLAAKEEIKDPDEICNMILAASMLKGIKLPEIKEKTQLDAVVEYLGKIYEEGNYVKQQPLWLPVLGEKILLRTIAEAGFDQNRCWSEQKEKWELSISVGLCDDPENQYQMPLKLNFTEDGNMAVCGIGMSGKSTFLQTAVYALVNTFSPEYLNIYALDFSNRMLEPFENAPHVGGILYENDVETVGKFFNMLQGMIKARKALFKGGNYFQYIMKNGLVCPAVVVVIDNIANFREKTEEKYDDVLLQISKECAANGIYLLISAAGFGMTEINGKLGENIKRAISLEMVDKYGYSDIIKTMNIPMIPDAGIPGRGLVKIGEKALEFQTCVAAEGENDYERIEVIRKVCDEMQAAWTGTRARSIPKIPEKPVWSEFSENDSFKEAIARKDIVPFGYDIDTADVIGMSLRRAYCYVVMGKSKSGMTNMLRIMMRSVPMLGAKMAAVEFGNEELLAEAKKADAVYISSIEEYLDFMNKTIIPMFQERAAKRKECHNSGMDEDEIYEVMKCYEPYFIFISDLTTFAKAMHEGFGADNNLYGAMTNFLEKGSSLNVYFIAQLDWDRRSEAVGRSVYESFVKYKDGVHLGGNSASQTVLSFGSIPYSQLQVAEKPGVGYTSANESEGPKKFVVPFYGK